MPSRLSALRHRVGGDRGAATTQTVIAFPVLLLIVLTIIQFAIWSQASHIAQATASQALATARTQNGTETAGTQQARHVLDQLGRGPLTDTTVTVERDTEIATVTVTGNAEQIVPFLHLPIRARATGPVEHLTNP